jgi:hypothetical protein
VSVHNFFKHNHVDLEGLSKHLDRLDETSRVREVRNITAEEQARLFDEAEGFLPLTVDHFVPDSMPPLSQVIHYGRNSLPLFRIFQKRFCRSPEKNPDSPLWGYNEQSFKRFTGPGYFVARQADENEVVIDYCEVPPGKPDAWPRVLPNSARLSRFIYFRTRDYMRGVSRHVSVGRATRDGKRLNNWFVLCRQEL